MQRTFHRKRVASILIAAALIIGFTCGTLLHGAILQAQPAHAATQPFKDPAGFARYIQQHHKAPFSRADVLMQASTKVKGGALKDDKQIDFQKHFSTANAEVQINQDRNPWPKDTVAAAIDPTNNKHIVVMSNDYRENWNHMFYHVSTDGGNTWTDDSMTPGNDPATNFVPFNFQSDPGIAFDGVGHTVLSTITGNVFFDPVSGYVNTDTEVEVAIGSGGGTYSSIFPIAIDDQPCNGIASGTLNCPATLDKPLVTVDNVPGSPNYGTIYVYYTLFCNASPCTDGSATIPAYSSAIMESHAVNAGSLFSSPTLVSGTLGQEQFSNMVIDSHGTPHIFFEDFSSSTIGMYESTLTGGSWVVHPTPITSFSYSGLNNPNWSFRDIGSTAPGCSIHVDTAYCAFSANQVGTGASSTTPSVYLANIDTLSSTATVVRVNTDPLNDGKDHFLPWASAAPNGNVYVGWYTDLNDPFNILVGYRVARSMDNGATFPRQEAINSVDFNPCIGSPACSIFGDYNQLVTGPDNVTHVVWTDTRDGASQRLLTRALNW